MYIVQDKARMELLVMQEV